VGFPAGFVGVDPAFLGMLVARIRGQFVVKCGVFSAFLRIFCDDARLCAPKIGIYNFVLPS
jgi:hypothetical protein